MKHVIWLIVLVASYFAIEALVAWMWTSRQMVGGAPATALYTGIFAILTLPRRKWKGE